MKHDRVIWNHIIEKEHEKPVTDMQKRTDFPGTNIIPRLPDGTTPRIGDDERRRTIHHIKEMETKGYIPPEEATARIEHVANAENSAALRYLTNDLPNPVDHRGYWKKWDWNDARYYLPVLLGTMFASLCSAVAPGVILNMLHAFDSPVGAAVFIPLLILGVIGFFTSMVLLVIKSSE